MAGEAARNLQFEYRVNSNIVTQADKSLIDRLVPAMSPQALCSRFRQTGKARNAATGPTGPSRPEWNRSRPKRKKRDENRRYEVGKLKAQAECLGDEPRDVLCGAADEVLAAMKDDKLRDKERKREIESLLGNLAEDTYALLVNLSKKATDWSGGQQGGESGDQQAADIDETYGVNIQFEDSDEDAADEDDAADYGEVNESDEDDDEGGEGEDGEAGQGDDRSATNTSAAAPPRRPQFVDVKLPMTELVAAAAAACTRATPGCRAGQSGRMPAAVEVGWGRSGSGKSTSESSGYEAFDLIKLVRQNRQMVLHCTLLAQAQSRSERNRGARMRVPTPKLAPDTSPVAQRRRQSRRRRGSRRIVIGGGGGPRRRQFESQQQQQLADDEAVAAAVAGGYIQGKDLDLEDLAFTQGSHLMANKRCQLPTVASESRALVMRR
uniref:Helicase_PWI domain-containing protein n=1 Tax=Macrostomum lignano TaxID=282301 RepID=A0A1I8FJT5_9PLAT